MNEPLAHSARKDKGIGTQSYRDHVGNVIDGSRQRADAMLQHYSPAKGWPTRQHLDEIVLVAAEFHDLGKLDPGFQKTLKQNRTSEDHIRHEDAGAAWLIKQANETDSPILLESAALINSHHQGLVRYGVETDDCQKGGFTNSTALSSESFRITDEQTQKATETRLEKYLAEHHSFFNRGTLPITAESYIFSGLTRRLLLSCLVDADHFDTAKHYQNERDLEAPAPRWRERLDKLESYVSQLERPDSKESTETELQRQEIRDRLFQLCRDADTEPLIRSCDAVVGSGKTTALMAHLLQVAIARNLRHIIVVLPYTNIITQSVGVYRKALCLEGENPEEVVAEHHHQVEFKEPDTRHLTTTWKAPIIVTTAVQLFETLAANNTARLRKLHELPGSAIFLDEAHAALPASLWPACWNWLTQWTRRWSGHLVLASGSLPEFWRLPTFRCLCEGKKPGEQPSRKAMDIAPISPSLKSTSQEAEHRRIKFVPEFEPLSVEALSDRVIQAKGPRIVVVNTVQSAAFLAAHLRDTTKTKILHLSTALTPAHRSVIIERVKNLLKHQTDWVLVATSLVEAGLDFSFFSGFRQRASAASLIQLGGRVNRSAKWRDEPFVLDFTFRDDDKRFPDNPILKPSQTALQSLFELGEKGEEGGISKDKPNDFTAICHAAIKEEFRAGAQNAAYDIILSESEANYPKVAELCRAIQSDTRTVVVDPHIARRIEKRKPVQRIEVIRNSVQMYHTKIEQLKIPLIHSDSDIYRLPDSWNYDPDFLGYMSETLRNKNAEIQDGFFI